MVSFVRSDEVAAIRRRLGHPIVDADGHLMEVMQRVLEILDEQAGAEIVERLLAYEEGRRAGQPKNERVDGLRRMISPTLDGMSVALPRLLYRRLDEIGLDYVLLFPSYGLTVLTIPDDDVRQAMARALNTYYVEACEGMRDRLEPVAVIPSFTPEEAVAALEHAVGTLGLKAIVMSGMLPRTGRSGSHDEGWRDTLGHDSLYDYDPFWARCVELGVVPAFHGHGHGWGSRMSPSNYTYNHVGHFAAARRSRLPIAPGWWRAPAFPRPAIVVPGGRRQLGRPAVRRLSRPLREAQRRSPARRRLPCLGLRSGLRPAAGVRRSRGPWPRGRARGSAWRRHRAGTAGGGQRAPYGRVRPVTDRPTRGDRGDLLAAALLRLRGRRSPHGGGLRPEPAATRHPAQRGARVRHRALRRDRRAPGAPRGLGSSWSAASSAPRTSVASPTPTRSGCSRR